MHPAALLILAAGVLAAPAACLPGGSTAAGGRAAAPTPRPATPAEPSQASDEMRLQQRARLEDTLSHMPLERLAG